MPTLKCPFQNTPDGLCNCIEDGCAIWNTYQKQCSILSMAGAVKLIQKYGAGKVWPDKGGKRGAPGEF